MRVEGSEAAAVFAGGFAGTLARVALAESLPAAAGQWPYGAHYALAAAYALASVTAGIAAVTLATQLARRAP